MRISILMALAGAFALVACGANEEGEAPAEPDEAVEAETVEVEPAPDPILQSPVDAAPEPVNAPMSDATAYPRIPMFNAVCGTEIEVHANEGGPVFIDGEETTLERFNENYFEASHGGTTISISFNPDDSLSLTFSGPNRANGVCNLE